MANTITLTNVLRGELGYHEGRDANGNWNNIEKYAPLIPELSWAQGQPWCAVFTTWAYRKAGVKSGTYAVTASVWQAMEWYKNNKRWSEYPTVGAQVIFGRDVHTGIVIKVTPTEITTIEGNTNDHGSPQGDGVYERVHNRFDDYVTGYGLPDFDKIVPAPHYAAFPGSGFFYIGRDNVLVTRMGEALKRAGYPAKYTPTSTFTRADIKAYAWWQQKLGYTGSAADGYPGRTSWDKLHVSD